MKKEQPKKQDKARRTKSTPRRQKLVKELANPENKTVLDAAKNAGYADSTARSNAYTISKLPEISEAVRKRIDASLANAQIDAKEVLGNAAKQMRASMDDLIDEQGYFDLVKARETGAIDLIKEMEIIEMHNDEGKRIGVKHKVKYESPAAARKELGNYLGLEKAPSDAGLERQAARCAMSLFCLETPESELSDSVTQWAMLAQIKEISELETRVRDIVREFEYVWKETRGK